MMLIGLYYYQWESAYKDLYIELNECGHHLVDKHCMRNIDSTEWLEFLKKDVLVRWGFRIKNWYSE